MKPNVFENAFAGEDGLSIKPYRYFLADDDYNVVNVGEQTVFVAHKYRDGNERKVEVGCFTSEKAVERGMRNNSLRDNESRRVSMRQHSFSIPESIAKKFEKYAKKKHVDKSSHKQPEQQMEKRTATKSNSGEAMDVDDQDAEVEKAVSAAAAALEMEHLKSKIATSLEQLIANRTRLIELQNKYISEDEASALAHGSVLYQYDNKPGVLDCKKSSGFFTLRDLEEGLVGDTEDERNARHKCGDKLFFVHKREIYNCWVPDRATIVDERSNNHNIKLADGAKQLLKHFDGKKSCCTLDDYSKDTLTAYSVAAAGASDWGKQSLICGSFKTVFDIMGLDVGAKALANGCPDIGSLANWEFRLAAGSLASAIVDIKADGARLKELGMPLQISVITDHGNRKGVDHFVKLLIWSSVDVTTGRRMIRRYNLDIDGAGHTTTEAVNAIKRSLSILGLTEEADNVQFTHIHGDRGGGGAVQSMYGPLVSLEVLHIMATWSNCILHAVQKALENAAVGTFGKQGMNSNAPFQLCYQAIMLLVSVKKKGGIELLRHYYSETLKHYLQSDKWQAQSSGKFILAFQEILSFVEEREDCSDEAVERLAMFVSGCPVGTALPNFGRWGTVSKAAQVVVKHWIAIHFMAITIKAAEKSESYLYKIANSLLDLMNARVNTEQKNPTHYVSLLWFNGFCGHFFDRHMEWFKRDDPVFGEGSYGQISRLVPEHLFIFFKELKAMMGNGWKAFPEFKPFLDAVETVPEMGRVKEGGKEFFVKVPSIFLKKFDESIQVQLKQWRSKDIIWTAIAGHPTIAKWLIDWIFNERSPPANLEVEMKHHYMGGGTTPVVNVRDCISFMTSDLKREDLESNAFLNAYLMELRIMAEGDGSIDPLDESTWADNDLKKLEEAIWNYIGCRPTHQQLAENLVQTAGHLAKTGVGEARRSARAKNHCIFARDFNTESVAVLRRRRKKRKRRAETETITNHEESATAANQAGNEVAPKRPRVDSKPRRPEGKQRLEMFIQYADKKLKQIKVAKEKLGKPRMKTIYNQIRTDKYKTSAVEVEAMMKRFEGGLAKADDMVIASKNLIEVTAAMDGAVVLRHLNIKNKGKEYLLAELDYRQNQTHWERYTTEQKLAKTEKELREILRSVECDRLRTSPENKVIDDEKKVNTIKPLSDKMQEWLEFQWKFISDKENS